MCWWVNALVRRLDVLCCSVKELMLKHVDVLTCWTVFSVYVLMRSVLMTWVGMLLCGCVDGLIEFAIERSRRFWERGPREAYHLFSSKFDCVRC